MKCGKFMWETNFNCGKDPRSVRITIVDKYIKYVENMWIMYVEKYRDMWITNVDKL